MRDTFVTFRTPSKREPGHYKGQSSPGRCCMFDFQSIFADILAEGNVEHAMPGRVRLRFRKRKGNTSFFKQFVALGSQHPAIEAIDANPRTGSILIHHSFSPDEAQELFRRFGERSQERAHAPKAGMHRELTVVGFQALSLLQAARGRVLSSSLEHLWQASQADRANTPGLRYALILMGMLQAVRGRLLASATSLFVYSLFTHRQL